MWGTEIMNQKLSNILQETNASQSAADWDIFDDHKFVEILTPVL